MSERRVLTLYPYLLNDSCWAFDDVRTGLKEDFRAVRSAAGGREPDLESPAGEQARRFVEAPPPQSSTD